MMASAQTFAHGASLIDAWHDRAARTPERAFLRHGGRNFSFGDMDQRASRVAAGLAALGLKRGDRLIIAIGNHPDFVAVHLASQWLGAISVPLVAGASAADMSFQIEHSQARIAVADAAAWAILSPHVGELPIATWILAGEGAGATATLADVENHPPAARAGATDPWTPSSIVYTSGSSGRPKGVVLPAASPLSVGVGLVDRLRLSQDDVFLLPTPIAHAVGLVTKLGGAILTGASIALIPSFSPMRFWNDVQDSGATTVCLFPSHLNLLMETDVHAPRAGESSLRSVFTHAYHAAFVERFGVALHMCWGMTETGGLMAFSGPLTEQPPAGAIGSPMPGVDVAAFDHEGRRLPAESEGELRLRHPHVMLRYHRDEKATAATLVDGWVRSGDKGHVTRDGVVVYSGRIKSMIKRAGENISPEEIEAAIALAPGVAECVCFGAPDPVRTEEVVVCIAMKQGRAFAPEAIMQAIGLRLSRWKLPRFLFAHDGALPRLANGKFDRRAIVAGFDRNCAWDARRKTTTTADTRGTAL